MRPPCHLATAALCLMLAAAPLRAEAPTPVQAAALSARLYAVGMAQADPVLVLAAARLRKQIAPVVDPGRAAEDAGAAEADPGDPLTWEAMAEAAVQLAEGDDTILGLIEDLRAETTKGVVSGPVYNIGSLSPRKTDTYARVDFRGGEYAEVYVEAKTTVDVNLTVLDAQGRLVCADTDPSHIAYCGWRPAETGAFTLKVENRGGRATGYALMTN
ncbi:MAG TPA: hypothetical protein PKD10_15800 [Paracoccaceae bacterium]|nr:hypothetical protein [Paracoccaceae bacterium]HMO73614.1 hypothetical protein [Paracoccaceae bacterium]